ncbi:MAG: EipB family protein [Acetobacteraceae bacterium]
MRHLPKLILILFLFAVASPGSAAPVVPAAPAEPALQPSLPFVGQRALYTLSLSAPRDTSVVAGSGRMGFEVLDACDGWAVRQRLEMTLINAEGGVTRTLSDYATWEAKNGLAFRFHTLDMTNGEITDRLAGVAHLVRPGGPGEVSYSEPAHTKVTLPAGTLFPMAQTEAIILAARAGKKFMASPLFDGTDATGASWSSVAIEGWDPPASRGAASRFPTLAVMPSTRVRVAFFSGKPSTMLPDFEIGMRYFLNGVADGLDMDFTNFSMRGKMVQLSILPSHC